MTFDAREDKPLEQHLEEFKTVGFTLFPKMLDDAWVAQMRDAFEEISDRIPNPEGSRSATFVDVLEHKARFGAVGDEQSAPVGLC